MKTKSTTSQLTVINNGVKLMVRERERHPTRKALITDCTAGSGLCILAVAVAAGSNDSNRP